MSIESKSNCKHKFLFILTSSKESLSVSVHRKWVLKHTKCNKFSIQPPRDCCIANRYTYMLQGQQASKQTETEFYSM